MAKLYLNKIKNGEINPQTELPWCLADVPVLWRVEVEALMDEEIGEE